MVKEYDTIIGIDPSLSDTGLAHLIRQPDPRKYTDWPVKHLASSAEFADCTDPFRQVLIVNMIVAQFKIAEGRVAVVIEDYAMGKYQGKIRERAELVGMIMFIALTVFGFDVYKVSPSALKKLMGVAKGAKKTDKADMGYAARQKFAFNHTNDNIVDAYCLAQYLVANLKGQRLTIVRHLALRQHAVLQVPAIGVVNDKNLRLTTPRPKPKLRILARPLLVSTTPTKR